MLQNGHRTKVRRGTEICTGMFHSYWASQTYPSLGTSKRVVCVTVNLDYLRPFFRSFVFLVYGQKHTTVVTIREISCTQKQWKWFSVFLISSFIRNVTEKCCNQIVVMTKHKKRTAKKTRTNNTHRRHFATIDLWSNETAKKCAQNTQ